MGWFWCELPVGNAFGRVWDAGLFSGPQGRGHSHPSQRRTGPPILVPSIFQTWSDFQPDGLAILYKTFLDKIHYRSIFGRRFSALGFGHFGHATFLVGVILLAVGGIPDHRDPGGGRWHCFPHESLPTHPEPLSGGPPPTQSAPKPPEISQPGKHHLRS